MIPTSAVPKSESRGTTRLHGFASRAVHAGEQAPYPDSNPASTPIYASSNFCFQSMTKLDAVFEGTEPGYVYGRYGNPTVAALETVLADLEGTDGAIAVSSGMAALHLALLHEVQAGDHIVAASDMYRAIHTLLTDVFGALGVGTTLVDVLDLEAVQAAVRDHRSRVILIETISNPLLKVPDLAAIGAIARAAHATYIVDNTFATPYLVNPIRFGADVVVHSTTKYLGGHGDVTGGAVLADADRIQGLTALHRLAGAVPGPFDAWLTLRGIKTLPLRVRQQSENAAAVATALVAHPSIAAVYYPGLNGAAVPDIFCNQHRGGMISFEIAGASRDDVFKFMEALRLIRPTTSLGDVYSLVLYPAMATHRDLDPEQCAAVGVAEGLVRMSCGIEDAADLIGDLEQALANI
ncbi:MAG TPA: PLP-dependent aspartate aminotransferase family protein [Thermomicrobiales bacterium]|nr:PLP-dependent aspartate aminotransferase family protein [Thermomicrobiales bacterium]